MTKLMQVKPGWSLLWPSPPVPRARALRGEVGYVVDLDAPNENVWCGGQMHKLEPAPRGAKPDKITEPVAMEAMGLKRESGGRSVADMREEIKILRGKLDSMLGQVLPEHQGRVPTGLAQKSLIASRIRDLEICIERAERRGKPKKKEAVKTDG